MNLINKCKKMKNSFNLSKNACSIVASLVMASSLFVFYSCSNDDTQTVTNFTQLVMTDEFDTDGEPNPAMWTFFEGTAFNGEQQYYTSRPENIKVEDGMLQITALKESFMGSNYTSARIETKGLFEKQYGRFEARIQSPWGQGIWPAFWLLGSECQENNEFGAVNWPNCGEIDVMEIRGQNPTIVSGAVHGPEYSGGNSIFKEYELTNDRFDTGFHIFGIEWGPGYINFYVDDVLYNQITPEDVTGEWVFDKPFYIIMNVAVGGGYVGSPNNQTVFPQTMKVDYVRVYEFE
jgi:beta-glucanase (GH16 family)